MREAITKIKGLTVNVTIIEMTQQDRHGGLICYIAAIYVQKIGSVEKTLVRKSRLPNAARDLKREIQRDGIRAFDRFKLGNEAAS